MANNSHYRLLIAGAAATGKSTFLNRLRGRKFEPRWLSNRALEHPVQLRVAELSTPLNLTLVDWDGQDYFNQSQLDFNDFDGYLFFYDRSNRVSAQHLKSLYARLNQTSRQKPTIVVANKSDLPAKSNDLRDWYTGLEVSFSARRDDPRALLELIMGQLSGSEITITNLVWH